MMQYLAAVAVAAVLLIAPRSASAQNPSADQYTPVTPSGGGPTPVLSGGADEGGSGASSGAVKAPSVAAATTVSDQSGAPSAGAASVDLDRESGGRPAGPAARSRDQRTLDGIVSDARQQFASNNQVAAARLLRETSGDSGLGGFFWVLLGATLIWATLVGIMRPRGDVRPTLNDSRNQT